MPWRTKSTTSIKTKTKTSPGTRTRTTSSNHPHSPDDSKETPNVSSPSPQTRANSPALASHTVPPTTDEVPTKRGQQDDLEPLHTSSTVVVVAANSPENAHLTSALPHHQTIQAAALASVSASSASTGSQPDHRTLHQQQSPSSLVAPSPFASSPSLTATVPGSSRLKSTRASTTAASDTAAASVPPPHDTPGKPISTSAPTDMAATATATASPHLPTPPQDIEWDVLRKALAGTSFQVNEHQGAQGLFAALFDSNHQHQKQASPRASTVTSPITDVTTTSTIASHATKAATVQNSYVSVDQLQEKAAPRPASESGPTKPVAMPATTTELASASASLLPRRDVGSMGSLPSAQQMMPASPRPADAHAAAPQSAPIKFREGEYVLHSQLMQAADAISRMQKSAAGVPLRPDPNSPAQSGRNGPRKGSPTPTAFRTLDHRSLPTPNAPSPFADRAMSVRSNSDARPRSRSRKRVLAALARRRSAVTSPADLVGPHSHTSDGMVTHVNAHGSRASPPAVRGMGRPLDTHNLLVAPATSNYSTMTSRANKGGVESHHSPHVLARTMLDMLEQRHDLCNIRFLVGPQQESIFALSAILAMHSSTFEAMFKPYFAASRDIPQVTVALPSVDANAFAAVITWCHTGELRLQGTTVRAVLLMAETYGLAHLEVLCNSILTQNIDAESALDVLVRSLREENLFLAEQALQHVGSHARELLQPSRLVQADVRPEELAIIMQLDAIQGMSELELYRTVVAWAKQMSFRCDLSIEELVAEPLACLRLNLIDLDSLLSVVRADGLIESSRILDAIASHSNPHNHRHISHRTQEPPTTPLQPLSWDASLSEAPFGVLNDMRIFLPHTSNRLERMAHAFSVPVGMPCTLVVNVSELDDANWVAIGCTATTNTATSILSSPFVAAISSVGAVHGNLLEGAAFNFEEGDELILTLVPEEGTLTITRASDDGTDFVVMDLPSGVLRLFAVASGGPVGIDVAQQPS
ncbi:uncharacterized protein MONBRDRAFT_23393 [Monosiga brevicollis MX1]|uniref:BTB domain-containing protein n=1 Tax=Monosiga brevicollis TaxID=81824 RepID=A9UT95_MONBE|nr:uncharacterized protein MONBRDRAFT_23393 [Monosiga brevicollis MX1]EDQ91454.1 predicted protein [Monosiga brevicollis MX1]|eukprot:XP_001743876.1 hypothetical protein [Monosiga brevicollis MX1]